MKNKRIDYRKKRKEKMVLLTSVLVVGLISFGITLSVYSFQKNKIVEDKKSESKVVYNSALSEEQKRVAENLVKELEKLENVPQKDNIQNDDLTSEISSNVEKIIDEPEVLENSEIVEDNIVQVSTKPAKEIKFIKPVDGKVGLDFSNDKVVYLKTLDEWGIHCGVDFLAEVGTKVKASSDGIVQKIYEDNEFGVSIVIEHESGLITKYSGVEGNTMVQVGDKVKQGDIIAQIAKPIGIEREEGSHLHFEVLENEVNIKPTFD